MRKKVAQKKRVAKKSTSTTRGRPVRRRRFSLTDYRIGRVLVYGAAFCGLSALCLFLSSTVLFSIKNISVQGDEIYEPQVVLERSGAKVGDNLLLLNAAQVNQRLEGVMPEVDEVVVTKKFPARLIIDVKRAEKAFDVELPDGSFVSISGKGKALEIAEAHDEELILLQGVELESFEVGSKVIFADKLIESRIAEVLGQMSEHNLPKVSGVNFSTSSDLIVDYDHRVKIHFGFYENMDYKIRTAAEIINNKLGAKETGTLDLSEVSKENRSYFTPES